MTRPLLLDLFCGAGGAAMGYHRAGFDVIGVDIKPQPRYPFRFVEMNAVTFLEGIIKHDVSDKTIFDAVHASPPCQDWSETRDFGGDHGTAWLLPVTRECLARIGLPWVIENVQGSPLAHQQDLFGANGLDLCGCMFAELRGLLYEDRLFETLFPVSQPPHVLHKWPQTKMGRQPMPGECMQVTGHFTDADEGRRRMRAEWMNRDELAQAIPPAYTEYIGLRLMEYLNHDQNVSGQELQAAALRTGTVPEALPVLAEVRQASSGGGSQ